jgi:hypothetical protein
MNRGVLIFAHNNRDVDYALMSIISGSLAKKNLGLPVSLVTDETTLTWMETSGIKQKAIEVFEQIIITDKPETDNSRRLHDGNESKFVPFVNLNRTDAFSLSPYDQTLLIDSDYLIFTDNLNKFWEYSETVLLGQSINDIIGTDRLGYHDRYVSDTGVHLYWATTVMFTKNEYSENFFSLLSYVKENYQYYSDLFRFYTRNYRNDIAFSVTQHIMDGFETKSSIHLPPVFSTLDRDILETVKDNGNLVFLINMIMNEKYIAASVKDVDIHVMNKSSITRNAEKLLALI